ncbi:hypothetical protein CAPTEDRAFT_128185 [Capitella teleta]|uniref:G-protein coupled receptors family 2 profile 2 domain-containing protein n=1 Tax=Capitella teleta TaxID=283909 RepID=R7V8G0_CAPTE|nr:hypothetical protein CAPTEDRAFT_128185 [Capitella teleta]|eukprot:ELU14839.1 hypothetical protein CAPTEDRAFT_128185 [Capitella teleta]
MEDPGCRSRDGVFTAQVFAYHACAACYGYLFHSKADWYPHKSELLNRLNGESRVADIHNVTIRQSVCSDLHRDQCLQWGACCVAAEVCCQEQLLTNSTDGGTSCPATWDGYACWPATPQGLTASQSCPTYIRHGLPSVSAYKYCTPNGTWYEDPHTAKEWTNYTTCLNLMDFKLSTDISMACNSASLLALIPAISIFLYFGGLRKQARIQLHVQLFLSFVLYALVNLLWDVLVVRDRMTRPATQTVMHKNGASCKLLYVLTRYTRSCNFSWMFCEAFYLHRLIVHAFQPPSSKLLLFVLGWGFPWLPVIAYSGIRYFFADDNCWVATYGSWDWLIYVPNLLSLAANLFFIVDILRILLTQLHSHPNEPSSYRRGLKATFLLVPLFGLQLLMVIYRPPYHARGSRLYEILAAFIINSQGFFVALIFCFLNGEVRYSEYVISTNG